MYDELVKRLRLAKAVLSRNKDLIALLSDAAEAIEELSKQPKPARSKWVNVEVSYVGDMKHNGVENVASMQCQNCKRYHNEVYFFGQAIEHVNYCPNCGARMEES